MPNQQYPGWARIDLSALSHNAKRLHDAAPNAEHMGIIKAAAYGHGATEIARTLVDAGYQWLGIAQVEEALTIRRALDRSGYSSERVGIFSWILPPGNTDVIREAIEAGIELSVSSVADVLTIAALALPARIHLKVDTGMSRAGARPEDFPALVAAALQAQGRGIETVGIWSHLARADEPGEESIAATHRQIEIFETACALAYERGLTGVKRHLAATSGQLWYPQTHFDLVRDGIGLYGLSPNPERATTRELDLRPVMTLAAHLTMVKHLPAGTPVSYGGTWTAPNDTWVGLVPLGYGDGIPRHASNAAPVTVYTSTGQLTATIVGRVCMDQFVINLGAHPHAPARAGDTAVLFGNPDRVDTRDCPSADDWADACGTINYEIVTRIGARVPRLYEG
ncbi:MAG: alanine racemase [Actinomycetaceae bacterium]|nr:alanine racemase [Actinomycetaceae bacterium]